MDTANKTVTELEKEMIIARTVFESFSDPDSIDADDAWRKMDAAERAYKHAIENRPATQYETWMY